MILTKFPISRHDPTSPTPWSAPVLRFLAVSAPPFCPPSGPATGTFNGLHPKGDFLAVNKAIAQGMPVQIFLV